MFDSTRRWRIAISRAVSFVLVSISIAALLTTFARITQTFNDQQAWETFKTIAASARREAQQAKPGSRYLMPQLIGPTRLPLPLDSAALAPGVSLLSAYRRSNTEATVVFLEVGHISGSKKFRLIGINDHFLEQTILQ